MNKKDRPYYSFQISTPSGRFSADLMESVESDDTATQVEITKAFFLTELTTLISPEDTDKDSRPTEYQLLFSIKNTMTDSRPNSKGWVQGLELWQETINKLTKIYDFYCGKHFCLG